jgi:diacylglycerol O-acyltransferase
MTSIGDLGPGVRRLRPDDHFMILVDTDATPMHIGALQYLEAPRGERAGLADRIRRQIAERLGHTPLMAVLRQSPDGYDSDVWLDVAEVDLDYHVQVNSDPLDEAGVRAFIAERAMERLDLALPPFRVVVLDNLEDDRAAVFLRVHHSVTDGVGFQTILGQLSDETAPFGGVRHAGRLPSPEAWRAAADGRFAAEEPLRQAKRAQIDEALAVLKSGDLPPRAKTPVLKLSGPTSTQRAYATLWLPLERVRAVGKALGGTVNDIFLALGSAAIRRRLIELDDLPDDPIVLNSARSYRRPEHGDFGNRIGSIHPHLATHLADPLARLRAIQQSMAEERARSLIEEKLLDAPEKPYGARDRRARFADRTSGGAAVLPGNVTLSNVPGPADDRWFAGLRQLANYPTPMLGNGRFLNITLRRNGPNLDVGVMADPTKLPDVERLGPYLAEALSEYEALAKG